MKANQSACVFLLLLAAAGQTLKAAYSFTDTGSMTTARSSHSATLLTNGQVLVAGGYGYDGSPTNSVELYNPSNGTWTVTGNLDTGVAVHTATLLPNGNVLVAGGFNESTNGEVYLTSAELYDPTLATWTNTGAMITPHCLHTATLLTNGRVLVAAGSDGFSTTNAELYDPASGYWTNTGSLVSARQSHTATLLPNGKVLVVGGYYATNGGGAILSSAELYDPATGIWKATGSLETARYSQTAILLTNGKVLVAGGCGSNNSLSSAELYDPATETWTNTGAMSTPRFEHTATLLPNGNVLVAGGYNVTNNGGGVFLASAEVFDPARGTWTNTFPMDTPRYGHTATLLLDGQVLVAGGFNDADTGLTSAELFSTNGTVLPSPIGITDPQMLASGQFQFSFDTVSGVNYAIQYSTNLAQWLPLVTLSGIGVPLTLIDPNAAGSEQRFYRVSLSPQQ